MTTPTPPKLLPDSERASLVYAELVRIQRELFMTDLQKTRTGAKADDDFSPAETYAQRKESLTAEQTRILEATTADILERVRAMAPQD